MQERQDSQHLSLALNEAPKVAEIFAIHLSLNPKVQPSKPTRNPEIELCTALLLIVSVTSSLFPVPLDYNSVIHLKKKKKGESKSANSKASLSFQAEI